MGSLNNNVNSITLSLERSSGSECHGNLGKTAATSGNYVTS